MRQVEWKATRPSELTRLPDEPVASLPRVAGGELLIPTLVVLFGADIQLTFAP